MSYYFVESWNNKYTNTTIRMRNKLLLIIAAALCAVSCLPMGSLFMALFGSLQ